MACSGNQNKFDGKNRTVNVIPYLFENARGPDGYQIKPSVFRKEMELSANERYEKLLTLRTKPPPSELNIQSFKLSPPIIIFQTYTPSSIYTIPLSVRNVSHVVRPLRLCFEKTPFFDVVLENGNEDRSSRVAPGMSVQYNVKFFPVDDIDYTHKINFFTEGGTFDIPIIAIGSRPILDIPDCISIPIGAVNIPSEKIIAVRNIGKVEAVFKLNLNPPFYVTPDEGILVPSEILQLKLEYKSETAGKKKDKLILSYDSGEQLYIDVTGGAKNVNVYLDRNFIRMDNTYRQLTTQKKLKIFNKSDHIVKFAWKQYGNKNIQDEEKLKYEKLFSVVCSSEKMKTNKLEFYDVLDNNSADIVEERIYHDEILYLEKNEEFLYIHPNFSIIPLMGEIWPDDYCEVMVVFRPTELIEHSSTAYCEITGHENRFALDLKGTGIGPTVELNVIDLEVGATYLHTPQSYELVIHNKSHVPAKLNFLDLPTVFGGKITCYPTSYTIPSFENYVFVVKFVSHKQGEFIEDIKFQVEDTGDILTCVLRGKILVPKIYFDVDELNFGVVPIGFPMIKTTSLCNNGNLDVHFSLRVLHDGIEPPLTCEKYASSSIQPDLPSNPQELSFDPMKGDVPQNVTMPLKVILTPNRVGTFSMPLLLDMWETETETEQLLLKWNCVVPHFECEPEIVELPFCFLNYAYNRTLKITNRSNVVGYFNIVPPVIHPNAPIIVSLGLNDLYVDGGASIEIPFTVICTKLGENGICLSMQVFGEKELQPMCTITCKGKGPVISLNKELIDFGNVNLLTEVTHELEIISDAPIAAEFKISFANPRSFWKATPCEGHIKPGVTLKIGISVCLYDRGKFNDKIIVSVLHGCVVTCNVVANGVGTSIVIEPNITPEYDFGTLFASKKYSYQFNVYNRGTKLHRLIFRREIKKAKHFIRNKSDAVVENNKCPFRILPDKFTLSAKTFVTITVEVYKETISCVSESYYLEASVEKQSTKELITNTIFKTEFVEPNLYISTHDLYFRVDRGTGNTFFHVQDSFDITNETVVPLDIEITAEEPFYVLDAIYGILSKCETDILKSETQRINVFFQCNEWSTLRSYSMDRKLKLKFKHNNYEEFINLHADVYFPNISVQPQTIDFQSMPIGAYTYMDVEIRNVSPLPVTYIWKWKESSIKMELFEIVNETVIAKTATVGSSIMERNHTSLFDNLGIYQVESRQDPAFNIFQRKDSMGIGQSSSFFHKSILKTNFSQSFGRDDEVDTKRIYCFLKNICFGLCHPYFDPIKNQELSVYKNIQKETEHDNFLDLFDVTPYYGTLEPFEIQTIRIAFHPLRALKVSCELELQVEGGPTEIVHVSGLASRITYDLSTRYLDFGRQIFCEICVRSLTLKNTGVIRFDYVIRRPTFGEIDPSHHLMEAAWMSIEPRKGFLEPEASVEITVRYFPGIIGTFNEVFEIQIGYETPIIIDVFGYGVIPQIYVSLPRTILNDNPVTLGYNAVASITETWLSEVQNINLNNMEDFKAYYDQDIPHCDRVYLKRDGWDVLSFNEIFPSKMDIELALERFITYHHIENHPEILLEHSKTKNRFINNLYVPHYTLDFGAVVIETTVTHSIIILNYGPLPVNIRLVPLSGTSGILTSGITVQFKKVSNLQVGEIYSMYVIFRPRSNTYPKRLHNIKYMIYLEVDHGARIPIEIKAAVTVPFLTFDPSSLDFGVIKCGECCMKELCLQNEGLTPCTWHARLCKLDKPRKTLWQKIKKQKSLDEKLTVQHQTNLKQFDIDNGTSGVIQPNDKYRMLVRFEPKDEGCHDVKLVITIDHNKQEKFYSVLRGIGILPTIQLSHNELVWGPVLPWSNTSKKVAIKNPNDFCIEYYLPEFDSTIIQEELVIKLLNKAFEKNQIHLPPRDCGEPMSPILHEFYRTVIDDLSMKIVNNRWTTPYEPRGRHLNGSPSTPKLKDMGKSVSKASMSISPRPNTPYELGTSEEIEAMVYGFVKEGLETGKLSNPIEKVWNEYNSQMNTIFNDRPSLLDSVGYASLVEDIMIVFHGAPMTDNVYTAHKIGKALGLDVINVDMLVIECLLDPTPNSPHKRKIKQILNFIDANYNIQMERFKIKVKSSVFADENFVDESDTSMDECIPDPIGELYDKVTFILNPQGDLGKTLTRKQKSPTKPSPKEKKQEVHASSKSPTPVPVRHQSRRLPVEKPKVKPDKRIPSRCRQMALLRKKSRPQNVQPKRVSKKEEPIVEDEVNDPALHYIPTEFIVDILKERLAKYKRGIIIDTLNSVFINSPSTLLQCLLNMKKNIKYTLVIMFGLWKSTLESYFLQQRRLMIQKQNEFNQRQTDQITHMTTEEYEQLNPSQHTLYQNVVLHERRLKHDERQALIDQKISNQLHKLKHDRNKRTMKFFVNKKSKKHKDKQSDKQKEKPVNNEKVYPSPSKPAANSSNDSEEEYLNSQKPIYPKVEEWENECFKIMDICAKFEKSVQKESEEFAKNPRARTMSRYHMGSLKRQASARSSTGSQRRVSSPVLTMEGLQELKRQGSKRGSASSHRRMSSVSRPVLDGLVEVIDVGISLWIVDCSKPTNPTPNYILKFLQEDAELNRIIQHLRKASQVAEPKPFSKRCAIYYLPDQRYNQKQETECFTIMNADLDVDHVSNNPRHSSRLDGSSGGSLVGNTKRSRTGQRRKKADVQSLSSAKTTVEEPRIKSRGILQPKEVVEYRISFNPSKLGAFEHKYLFETQGWPKPEIITCKGYCEIPHIDSDPTQIFPIVKIKKELAIETEPIFYLSTQTLDFGGCLLGRINEKMALSKYLELTLTNASQMECNIHFLLFGGNSTFDFYPKSMLIPIGQTEKVKIFASPQNLGIIQDQFGIFVKNNPHIEMFKILVQGIKFECDFIDKRVNFDRLLIFRKSQKKLVIRNKSILEVLWRFVNFEEFKKLGFDLSAIQGTVPPLSEIQIGMEYTGYKAQQIRYFLEYEMYESQGRGDPFIHDKIEVTAESFDVQIDVYFAMPEFTHIQFGDLKVSTIYKQKVGLFNRSVYPVNYRIDVIPNEKHNSQILMWGIEPPEGILPKDILTPVTFAILPKQAIDLNKLDVFMVYLTDKATKTRIAQFPLQVSFTSYYSEYEICPNILDFGPLLLEEEKVLCITLKNIGKFPFAYKIQGGVIDIENKLAGRQSSYRQAEKAGKKGKTKEKKEKTKNESKKPAKKDKAPASGEHDNMGAPLVFSIFEIGNVSNIVAVGEVKQIPVNCLASELGKHEATIQIFISECLPQFNKSGHIITLKAQIDIPKVNLQDFDAVFRESYIFNTRIEFENHPKKVGSYTVFIKNDLPALRFQHICLNKEFTTRIRIKNIGKIPAVIVSSLFASRDALKSGIKENVGQESDTNQNLSIGPFSISPKNLYLDPYVEGVVNVTFRPISIQNFECDLLCNLVLPHFLDPCMMTIKLIGDVEVPHVVIEDPKFIDENYNFTYPLCLIGQQCKKKLILKNIGNIPAKVSLRLTDDKQIFYFIIDDTLKERCTCISKEECKFETSTTQDFILSINCDETVDVDVVFDCNAVGVISTTLEMAIFDNPFENKKITVNGEGFSDDMMVIGLPLTKLRQSPPPSSGRKRGVQKVASTITWGDGPGTTIYTLDFGEGHVNELRAIYFTLSNCTNKLQYFEFVPSEINDSSVTFSPVSGFMAGNEKKDIVATYILSVPRTDYTGKVELRVSDAINNLTGDIPEEEGPPIIQEKRSERKEKVKVSTKSTAKVRNIELEIPKTIGLHKIPGTERRYAINISANTSYSEFTCPIEHVEFENTMIFERREIEFQITNTADVPLIIDWYLKDINNRIKSSKTDTNFSDLLEPYRSPSARYKTKPKFAKIKQEKWSDLEADVNLLRQLSSSFRINEDYIAFNITPDYIEIPPNRQHTFTITFMPLDAVSHKCFLISEIKHLSPSQQNIVIELTGNGLFPYCHFQTEFSDYIISQRRNMSLPHLTSDWKVIELNVVGLFNTISRAFKILNPMDDEIFYSWNRISDDTIDPSSYQQVNKFLCHKPTGSIKKHRYDVAEFSFYPSEYGIFEDKYLFNLENYKWTAHFLFVANVRKANIYCENSILHLKPTICGIIIQDTLVLKNDENIDFPFYFDERSMCLVDTGRKLLLDPKEGILASNSETPIKVTYKSERNGDFIFDLRCYVKGLDEPLKMVVCGSCYKLDPVVSCTRMGVPKETLQIGKPYIITQNNVCEEFNEFMDFSIKNKGKTKFFFVWSFDVVELDEKFMIQIEPDKGHVKPNCTEVCTILIKTLKKAHVENIRLLLEIAYGPTYEIILNLDSLAPAFQVSFKKHNFGKCFIRPEPIWFYQKILQIKNIDNIPLTVECLTNSTSFLKIDYELTTILPKETVSIRIFFQPREKKLYKYIVTFTINSLPCDVQFEGEGIDLMVQLVNPSDAVINFGRVLLDTIAEKIIMIRNASVEPVEVLVDLHKKLSFVKDTSIAPVIKTVKAASPDSKTTKKSAKIDKSAAKSPRESTPNPMSQIQDELNTLKSIRIIPSKSTVIAPKKDLILKILFSPETFIPPFEQLLSIQMVDDVMPLSLIKGEAVGMDVTLSQYSIPFGIVTKGCKLTSYFLLQNKGGVDIKFNWEFKKHSPHFSMEPMSGLVGAESTVKHTVTFCPQECSSCLFRAEAICKIVGLKNKLIVFTGRCEDLPTPSSSLVMRCPVRDTQISIISIHNNSTTEWELIPTIWGEYFSCDESILIGPGMSGTCSISYKPLTMTSRGENHKGYVLLKYPNGKGELHTLLGIAEHPKPEEEKTYNLSAKKDHTLQLIIHNWLPIQQTFNVITEQAEIKSEKKSDIPKTVPNYKVTGQDSIEVPGNWGKQYLWTFYGYNEGTVKFKVVFVNVDTNEFLYYMLLINVTKCESLETIKISTPIRLPKQYDLIIHNPLNQPIDLDGICQSPYIKFDTPFNIPPKDKVKLPITYCPLVMEKVEAKLELVAMRNLGSYEYTLELNGLAPLSEKLRTVTTYFGKTESLLLEISTCSIGKKFEFVITSSHPSIFVVPRMVSILNSGTITVIYDPYELGTTEGIVTAESPIAGKYTFPIQATCLYPKPMGPYTFLASKTRMEVNFRNPFTTDQVFLIRGEPQGVINIIQKSGQDTIKSKAEKKIIVTMGNISNIESKGLITGRVIIQSKNPNYANVSWTYYFQNDIQET